MARTLLICEDGTTMKPFFLMSGIGQVWVKTPELHLLLKQLRKLYDKRATDQLRLSQSTNS